MNAAVLAVDAGGTHTRALVRLNDGRTGRGESGPANWTTLGPERAARAIAEAAHLALQAVGLAPQALGKACVSLAGYYPPWHEREARRAISAELPAPALRVVPDLWAAWAGATGGAAGIVLVAGTGAAAYGRDHAGRTARAGGWGPLFGDEGGGYWIGCEALRAIGRALDRRGPQTGLCRLLLHDQGLERPTAPAAGTGRELPSLTAGASELEEALRAVYRDGWSRESIAALSVDVSRCAAAGDAVAVEILERTAGELGALIAAVARRLEWRAGPLRVSAVGGVMNAGLPLSAPLERWLAAVLPHAHWEAPLGSPLEGALWLAQAERPL